MFLLAMLACVLLVNETQQFPEKEEDNTRKVWKEEPWNGSMDNEKEECGIEITNPVFVNWIDRMGGENETQILRHIIPPFLVSFGGSGNTITRLLLEFVFGYYTGSVYNDLILKNAGKFLGEGECDYRTLVVKLHPENFAEDIYWMNIIQGKLICLSHAIEKKYRLHRFDCLETPMSALVSEGRLRRYNNDNWIHFQQELPPFYMFVKQYVPAMARMHAIVILRNPWDAMFSLYQQKFVVHQWSPNKSAHFHNSIGAFHTDRIQLKWFDFNISNIQTNFQHAIASMLSLQLRVFDFVTKMSQSHKKQKQDYILIKFEHLLNFKNYSIQFNEINKIAFFLYSDQFLQNRQNLHFLFNQITQKLTCFRRFGDRNKRVQVAHRPSVSPNSTQFLSKEFAYSLIPSNVICKWWKRLQPYAQPHGYTVWNPSRNKC
ncbi:hypothetical protein RFI_24781 [Reticulomyxa filosa]|uniref:Sulfotransferase domain-containing protein n=1 Tax=Reticulomyxa filosa TaxID=46433 RepID=X6MEZ3_RETFI|nr:hypothetical protein RFI_24781 [Reticulomyxa filosa]|eukprot:ETO12593.1 hypothetical protein RFI_24781 [Reticulomyxa filosa]